MDKTIGFKVDRELYSKLLEAAEREGIGPHIWAKQAMIRILEDQNYLPKISLQVEAIKQELLEIRKDIAVATEGILVSGGKATLEQAAKFVNTNLRDI
jgi:hypothetical protein